MQKNRLTLAITIAYLSLYSSAHADWAIGGYLEQVNIDNNKARSEGVDDTAYAIGFSADYIINQYLSASLGSSIIIYDDEESFTETVQVVGGIDDGDIETADSSANAIQIYAGLGPQFFFGNKSNAYFKAHAGLSNILQSERSIGNCSDCREEDIDIDSGAYIQASLGYQFKKLNFSAQYTQYANEDKGLSNTFRLVFASRF